MALDQKAKRRFIEETVKKLTKNMSNPSDETIAGMRDYATDLCEVISELILSTSIVTEFGVDSKLKIQ